MKLSFYYHNSLKKNVLVILEVCFTLTCVYIFLRFGFVDFEREDNCKAAKEAMEDCEIDGSEVTVAYAKPKGEKGPPGAKGGLAGRPAGKPAGQGAGGRGGNT